MSALLVDAGWDNNEPTPIFWDAVNHLFGEGSTPTLPPTGPPPAAAPVAECSCDVSDWPCLVHGDLDDVEPDPDATDTQVLEAVEPDLPSRRPRDEHGRFLPKIPGPKDT